MRTQSHEVMRARHTYNSHDTAVCAACNEALPGNTYQSTNQPKGKGAWAKECSACGVITWYDIDDGTPYGVFPVRESNET